MLDTLRAQAATQHHTIKATITTYRDFKISIPSLCEEPLYISAPIYNSNDIKEGANKQVISSQADSLIKISRIWADFFPANTSNQPI